MRPVEFFEGQFKGGFANDFGEPLFGPDDSIIRIDISDVDPNSPGGGTGGGGGYIPNPNPIPIPTPIPIDSPPDIIDVLPVIKGCMDKSATNYNPSATISDIGLCTYPPPPEPTVDNEEYIGKVNFNFKSNKVGTELLVNGTPIGTAPNSITLTDKELLTPRIIEARKNGYFTAESYEVYTKSKKFKKTVRRNSDGLPIVSLSDRLNPNDERIDFTGPPNSVDERAFSPLTNTLVYTYYELFVMRIDTNGNKIPVPVPNITDASSYNFKSRRNSNISLSFGLNENITSPPPKPTTEYVVRIIPTLSSDDIIVFKNQKGQGGLLKNNQPVEFKFTTIGGETTPFIELQGNGISNNTHTVTYEFRNNSSNSIFSKKGLEAKFELFPGNNDIAVNVVKVPSIPVPEGTPLINVSQTNISINKFDESVDNTQNLVNYSTQDADFVTYTKGTERLELPANGSIQINPSDFEIGTTKIYLQPVSRTNGSGPYETITITTFQKSYLPGPDITHIDYPRTIKGKDFAEYNIDFNVSWQSKNTNYVLVYVGDVSDQKLLGKFTNSGKAKFNVADIVRKSGQSLDDYRDITRFKMFFVPYNSEGDEVTAGKTEEISITFDKGDLKLRRANVIADIRSAFESELNTEGFKPIVSPFLTHYLHLGNADNKLVGTFGIDRETLSEKRINPQTNQEEITKEERSIVLKLYEPLPRNINTNDKVWISKIQSIPVIDQITITEDTTKECKRLTPNFDLDFYDDIGYQIYDELVASGSTTSTSVVNEFISSSGFSLENLDLNFVTGSDYYWENFVKYSNAEERVENFYYKVKLIEAYEDKITQNNNLLTGSSSPATLNENERNRTKINNIKKEFDAFEKFLFTSSSESDLSYPKVNNTGSLLHTTSSTVLSWYNGIKSSAQSYDYNNLNSLRNNLPEHILKDSNNSDYILFFDMIGQHFDVVYTHAKGFAQSRKLEHKLDNGIKDSLVYHMLESLGWNTKSGQESQFLWEYAFGLDKDGTQVSALSGRDRQEKIWRRILNNLPYLYKQKGTKRAIHAAMSCYGVPASMLTIMEFGGPKDPTLAGTTKFSFEDRTAAINISGSASILVPWKEYNGDHPNSVEIRVQTSQRQDQRIISGDSWSLDVLNTGTGSLARVQLTVGDQSSSTQPIPFFNDEYSSIFINRISGSLNYSFDLYVKEAFQERIRNEGSASISSASLAWELGTHLVINPTGSFTGSIDEFRLWKDPLSQSLLDNHTLLPDAINGNHISSSTEDLLLRHDFEYPKNRHTSGDVNIKNVALIQSYTTSSVASNFTNVTDYPYQYTPYDRTVTAEVPSSGFNVSNKVRFEDQTLISNLNYKTRATRKMYDQAPIDSNRLGLFFSPIKEINMDILKSLGSFNIDNYIGDPSDEYSYEYRNLRDLRNYYFDRYTLNFQEYIQLVRYIDKSLFDVLESLVPARAKVSKGLLIEPHILERSKTEWSKPTGSKDSYETSINTQDNINIESENSTYLAIISASDDTILSGETPFYSTTIDAEDVTVLSGDTSFYDGKISTEDTTNLSGFMTVNSGSDMGGISITIDAQITASIVSQYDSTQNYQQVGGFTREDIAVTGFGLYGENGESIRTRVDEYGNKVKDRVKVYLLTERYTELVPTTSGSKDGEYYRLSVPVLEEVTKYRTKVNILPFTGSNGLESQLRFTGSENYYTHSALDGYFPTHYRYVGDLPTGLQNSYFNGSKQTSLTTLDGGSPVQTFTTNPNTLRVADTGRGSGEPILEVD